MRWLWCLRVLNVTSISTTKRPTMPTSRASRLPAIGARTGTNRTSSALAIDAAVATANRRTSIHICNAIGAYTAFSHYISELLSCKHPSRANFKLFKLKFFHCNLFNLASIIGLRLFPILFYRRQATYCSRDNFFAVNILYINIQELLIYRFREPAPVNT